jgi:hypothetical protein
MNASEFVDIVNKTVRHAAVVSVISVVRDPPGQRPAQGLVELSEWYSGLDASSQAMVERILDMVSSQAVFGFLCILDGVQQVEGKGPKGHFELHFIKEGRADLLNDPAGEMLHDLLE